MNDGGTYGRHPINLLGNRYETMDLNGGKITSFSLTTVDHIKKRALDGAFRQNKPQINQFQ